MRFSTTDTRWVKYGKPHDFVFLGKDVIATASSIYITFLHLVTKEERIERFDNKERGDGASCLAGHSVVPMFSVVERKSRPKISVFTYPGVQVVSRCSLKEGPRGYLACAFAGTEYLLSLTTCLDFQLIVWLWRTGEMLTTVDTKIHDLEHTILCSLNAPHLVAQFARTTGKLLVYQINACSRIIKLHSVEISVTENKISSLTWSPEGNLFLCDEFCNVWCYVPDTSRQYVILKSETAKSSGKRPLTVAYRNGIIIVDCNSNVSFYRKASSEITETWCCVWIIKLNAHPIRMGTHHLRNSILLHTEIGKILEITVQNENTPRVQVISSDGVPYEIMSSISMLKTRVLVLDKHSLLTVFEVSTGKVVTTLNLQHHGKVVCINRHPYLPIISTCSSTGNCLLVSFSEKSKPKILKCFHLCREPLCTVKFSDKGEILGVTAAHSGHIFIIGEAGEPKRMEVLGLLNIEIKIEDFLIYNETNNIQILLLPNTHKKAPVGNKIIVYTCKLFGELCPSVECIIELLAPVKSLLYGPRRNIDILTVPYLSKQLHRLELQKDYQGLILVEAIGSMHQLRNIGINATPRSVQTCGYDGLVMIRDATDLKKVVGFFMPHHRSEGGARDLIMLGEIIISLGRNGNLVATRLRGNRIESARALDKDSQTTGFEKLQLFSVAVDDNNKHLEEEDTWMEMAAAKKLRRETEEACVLRESITADLRTLKDKVRQLLNENEKRSKDNCLPISNFDLNSENRKRRIEEDRLEREKFRQDIEERIATQDKVSSYLRKEFWESMSVHGCSLVSIFSNMCVNNYPLTVTTQMVDDFLLSEQVALQIVIYAAGDCEDRLLSILKIDNGIQSPSSVQESNDIEQDSVKSRSGRAESAIKVDNKMLSLLCNFADKEEMLCLSGTTTHRWLQEEILSPTEHQLLRNVHKPVDEVKVKAAAMAREQKLKILFNQLFEEMRTTKEREMVAASRRIERLHHCADELKIMFGIERLVEPNVPPDWHFTELSDHVVTVREEEINVPLSAMLENGKTKRNEEDTLDKRLLYLPDEKFCEEKLEETMDGMLEVRWEDEIKKDILKPDCLNNKDPAHFSKEDLEAIRSYESKVQRLETERQKYKNILKNEIAETEEALWGGIQLFNDRLNEMGLTKIHIECAILQEKLMRLRTFKSNDWQLCREREMRSFSKEVLEVAVAEAKKLHEVSGSLEMSLVEIRNRYEACVRREKSLEGKFRTDFVELKQPMVDFLLRHYKRRPRAGSLTCTSVTYLNEVGKCIVSNERSEILPRDCSDFLRGMNILDMMPGGLPAQIDVTHWRTMCKLRRVKIEAELKVKSCAVEMAEAEQSYSFYQKLSAAAQAKVTHLRNNLENQRQILADTGKNLEIQLILKMSQIEVPLYGDTRDLENAVLISREKLVRVNKAIIAAGGRKLTAMRKAIELRKTIAYEEWHHECMQITLRDLQEELQSVKDVKVTRDVLQFLEKYPKVISRKKQRQKIERNAAALEKRLREIKSGEERRLQKIINEASDWKKRNMESHEHIEKKKEENAKLLALAKNETRVQQEKRRNKIMEDIMKRNTLVTKIQQNYEELLTLHAQLEVIKLRTYPTLRLNINRK